MRAFNSKTIPTFLNNSVQTTTKHRPDYVHQRPNNDQTTTKQRPTTAKQRPNNDQTTTKQARVYKSGVGLQVQPGTTNLAFDYKTNARKVDKYSTLNTAPTRSVIGKEGLDPGRRAWSRTRPGPSTRSILALVQKRAPEQIMVLLQQITTTSKVPLRKILVPV